MIFRNKKANLAEGLAKYEKEHPDIRKGRVPFRKPHLGMFTTKKKTATGIRKSALRIRPD